MREIEQILESYHITTLKQMAEVAGVERQTTSKKITKGLLLELMPDWYFGKERVMDSYARLGQLERDVLNRLLLRGQETAKQTLQRETNRAGLTTAVPEPEERHGMSRYRRGGVAYDRADYNGSPYDPDSTIFDDVIARLTYRGLVFSKTGQTNTSGTKFKVQFHPAATLFVPYSIRRWLPEPVPIAIGSDDWQAARLHSVDPAPYLRNLYLYWGFVRRNEITLIRNGFVGKRDLKRINEQLLTPDSQLDNARHERETAVLYPLRLALQGLGLVGVTNDNKLVTTEFDAITVPQFWSGSTAEQVGSCLQQWPKQGNHSTLDDDADRYDPRYTNAYTLLRRKLSTLPAYAWMEPTDFLEEVQNDNVNFLFASHSKVESSRRDRYSGSIGGSYIYGDRREILQTLEQFEKTFIRQSIADFLVPLGLVELGYQSESDESWHAFRLTDLGRQVIKQETPQDGEVGGEVGGEVDAHQGAVVVQPNFHILAMGPVPLSLLAQLDLFAERERADIGAFEYRLTREAVYAAQQLGMDTSTIQQTLSDLSGTELPQNVRRTLEEWSAHHERIVFHTDVDLLQTADAQLLEKLMEAATSGPHLARALAPAVALIKKDKTEMLTAALLTEDVFPAISIADPSAADASVTIDESGAIQPIHAVPSLHLRGRLARVAEEGKGGKWQLTAKSVHASGGNQQKVSNLLDELDKLHRGTLPDALCNQVKAWGSYYGSAGSETLTLVEFQNRSILDELLNEADLAQYLTPFTQDGRALAIVEAGKLAEVKKVLRQFGVPVKKGIG